MCNLIFSFDTALSFWSNPRVPNIGSRLSAKDANDALSSMTHHIRKANLKELSMHGVFEFFPKPYDLLTSSQAARQSTRLANYRLWQTSLPDNSLVDIIGQTVTVGGTEYRLLVASPELCFFQMAKLLPLVELIELGYELCGTYAISPCTKGGLIKRQARTTPGSLKQMIELLHNFNGVEKARRAVAHIQDNSRSPKETQISMLASLPTSLGGFGIHPPLLNHELQITDGHMQKVLEGAKLIPDLYWLLAKLILEYDSRDWHSRNTIDEHDARKRTVYNMLGLSVITLTKGQLYDYDAFNAIMQSIRTRVNGRALTHVSKSYEKKRRELHRSLLMGERHERKLSPDHIQHFSSSVNEDPIV